MDFPQNMGPIRHLLFGLAALLAAWLHPWQGETLVLILGGLLIWGRGWRERATLGWPIAAAICCASVSACWWRWGKGIAVRRQCTDRRRERCWKPIAQRVCGRRSRMCRS